LRCGIVSRSAGNGKDETGWKAAAASCYAQVCERFSVDQGKREFRGYYCARCHLYSRLYRDNPAADFRGVCPRCGAHLSLSAAAADEGLFFTGGNKAARPINVRDACGNGTIIGSLPPGTPAQVLETRQYAGVVWYHIRTGQIQGWVSGVFIRKRRSQ
jgi:hypothetical protein